MLGKNKLIAAAARHTCTVFHDASKLMFFGNSGSEITLIPLKLIKIETWFVEKVYGPTNSANILCVLSITLHGSWRDNQFPLTFLVCKLPPQPI